MKEFDEHQNELEFMLDEIKEIYNTDILVLETALRLATKTEEEFQSYIEKAHEKINSNNYNERLN
jgi:uncharacterized protein YqgQ